MSLEEMDLRVVTIKKAAFTDCSLATEFEIPPYPTNKMGNNHNWLSEHMLTFLGWCFCRIYKYAQLQHVERKLRIDLYPENTKNVPICL